MSTRVIKPLKTERPTGRTVQRRVKGTNKAEKQVEFVLHRPEAGRVTVAGTFNDWDPEKTPLNRDPEAGWKVSLSLKPHRSQPSTGLQPSASFRISAFHPPQ